MSLVNKWIRIQAYKHDGELHRMWSHSFVIDETDDYYILVSNRARVVEAGGRIWHTKEPALFIFSKKEWFNVIAMIKEKGVTYYVNLASPTIYDNNMLKYIDYDLDMKLYPGGSKKLLDFNEYQRHADTYHYDDKIKAKLDEVLKLINKKMDTQEFPFISEEILRLYNKFEADTEYKKSK